MPKKRKKKAAAKKTTDSYVDMPNTVLVVSISAAVFTVIMAILLLLPGDVIASLSSGN